MKIRAIGFRPNIYTGLTSANFRQIAQDALTTKNLELIVAPKESKPTPSQSKVTVTTSNQPGKSPKK